MWQKRNSPDQSNWSLKKSRSNRVFYGWYIAIAGCISGFLNNTIFTIGLSAFIPKIREDTGWSLTAISLGFSIKQFEQGLLGPISGYLIDRVGPRLMCSLVVIITGVGLLLFARMDSFVTFYSAAVIIAFGQSMGAIRAYTTTIVHWFQRKRGLAAAILGTGFAMGYVGVYPISLLLVKFGWRDSAVICAIVFLVISFPLAQVIRHRPQPFGLLPDGDSIPEDVSELEGASDQAEESDSFTVLQALRTRPFWMVLIARAFYGLTTNVHHVHQIPHLINRGYSPQGAGLFVAVYGLFQMGERLACGPLGDRIGRFRMYRLSFLFLGVGWVFFAYISPQSSWVTVLFFLTYGLGHAAHTVAGQPILADYFGPNRFGTISGIMSPISLTISVIGPLYGGVMFDMFGNFQRAFVLLGPVIASATVAMFLAGSPTLAGSGQNPSIYVRKR